MLSVADESVPLDKARSNILIYPRQSFISIAPPADSPATPAAEGIGVYKGDISIDFPVKVMDIEVGYEIDYDLIDTYNLENNTHYLAPPPTLTVSLGAE